ncbi:MAG: hypothetical protein A2Z96_03260 [Spirochaetes bacterium GWB1_48_6]|nr:MAG: hypothetical protein A2Z96_03260 [Spirochaetes bacterium GWB1_48_6]
MFLVLGFLSSCQSPNTLVQSGFSDNSGNDALWANDWSLNLYRQPEHRSEVEDFYTALTGDSLVTKAILQACDTNDVPPSLAFALVSTESEFNPKALGYNSNSRDYGLFQLNSRTYPKLKPEQAFNPFVNAQYGASHLRASLEMSTNPAEALAIYNAGPKRVQQGLIPHSTRTYVKKIISLKNEYETQFMDLMFSEKLLAQGIKSSKAPGSLLDTASPF